MMDRMLGPTISNTSFSNSAGMQPEGHVVDFR